MRDVVRFLTTMAETLRTSDTKGGESSDFFEREQDRCMSHVVTIVKAATGEVSGPALQSFLAGAAMNPQQLSDESWRAGFHNSCLKVAYEKDKTPMEAHDVAMAMEYFLGEWPNMADRQRSGILTGVMGLFFVLNSGMTRELVSTTTNVTPDDTLNGKFILVDMLRLGIRRCGGFGRQRLQASDPASPAAARGHRDRSVPRDLGR